MKINKTLKLFLLFLFFLTSLDCFSQGIFTGPKYTGGKVRVWIRNHLGAGGKIGEIKKNLNEALNKMKEVGTTVTTFTQVTSSASKKEESKWSEDIANEITNITNKIINLINEASALNPFKSKDKKRITEIELILTDLIIKKIIPFQKIELQIKNAKVLATDYAFHTGKSALNARAVADIISFQSEWEDEILKWKNYKDLNGNYQYQNEQIYVRINVIGYADKQGSSNQEKRIETNRVLSEKRAQNVKREIQEAVKDLANKYNLDFEYITIGKGEELPPNTFDTDLIDNPDRRKVVVTAVIYPNSLLKKKIDAK